MMEKSKQAVILEKIARRAIVPKGKTMSEVILRFRKMKGKKKYDLPLLVKIKDRGKIDDIVSRDMHLFYMNVESQSDKLIIYLHGGAYVKEMLPFHWLMLDKITSRADVPFIIPEYPLAPFADYEDCYQKMEVFYRKVLEYYPDKKIILMGDSAGGGLALGLAMYFHTLGLKTPEKLILMSPWVDLVMDNPEIEKYIPVDPTLKYDDLSVDARFWANGTDLRDYRLSPIYGDLEGIRDVSLFTGTHEFFYPDIVKFYELCKEKKIPCDLHIGEGLDHVYPAYPIPEADEAIETMVEIIEKV
ncbi:MAG: alpha/beta hydrolase [Erysipelotrichaceae bacterium]|nr:alpha/beta hydrolase [Erysipelotrichaceae bacterium]